MKRFNRVNLMFVIGYPVFKVIFIYFFFLFFSPFGFHTMDVARGQAVAAKLAR